MLPSITKEPPSITAATPADDVDAAAKKAPNDFGLQLSAGIAMLEHEQVDRAIPYLQRARELFPEYGGDDSPYALLAAAYEKKGMRKTRPR